MSLAFPIYGKPRVNGRVTWPIRIDAVVLIEIIVRSQKAKSGVGVPRPLNLLSVRFVRPNSL